VAWAFSVDNTLWFTLNIGVASVVPDAGTTGSLVDFSAEGIDAARRGIAGLHHLYWKHCTWFQIAA
jgi:hypothetical protein